MTLEIKVTVPQDAIETASADTYLERAMSAIGYRRGVTLAMPEPVARPMEGGSPAVADAPAPVEETPKKPRTRRTKEEPAAEPQPNISTGEERIDPAAEAQDAADEAADPANAPTAAKTRDDVRREMEAYRDAYGMAALAADMSALLKTVFPAGNVGKLSEIPENADDFARVVSALSEMRTANPHNREKV